MWDCICAIINQPHYFVYYLKPFVVFINILQYINQKILKLFGTQAYQHYNNSSNLLQFCLSLILVIFHFGHLPFWSSSILVVFHFGRLTFWSSSILVVFHFGRLPFWSSSILVVFHFGRLPFC